MISFLSINNINLGCLLLTLILFLMGDMLLSSVQSFGQYFSFDVFVYSFSGNTHWANILIKHLVPAIIGGLLYVSVARAFAGSDDEQKEDLKPALAGLELSVFCGILLATIVIAWPSIRFPQLLLFDYDFELVLASAVLFSLSFSASGVVGVRVGRMIWHPQEVEENMPGSVRISAWRESFGPLLAAVVTGVVASLIATLSGA